MMDNKKALEDSPITYIPYVETKPYEAGGLLEKWMDHADVLLSMISQCTCLEGFQRLQFHWASARSIASILNGFISMRQDRDFTTAYSLRRHLHKTIIQHMSEFPLPNPVENAAGLPKFSQSKVESIFKESDTPVTPYEFIWRICEIEDVGLNALSVLSIDHSVPPVQHTKGVQ